ncbi:uncharacterized protein LOC131051215 [Cryptomeria japonica]|uniref:uncharacterized protein LOC131051215 n=1 Tax=Cryptomeria japonica TaxID=3369 RepID=UPI0027DA185B|nr:uncharacterized protein LOC131051215 [Cryptomeria japonica]
MAYIKMPFGLSNAGATFQRAMDMALKGLINKFVLVYLDDISVFSRSEGISIDPERITTILALPLPTHKKGLQSFIGGINFVRRFIPNIAALLQPLTTMLKKNVVFKWTKEGTKSFADIKEALASAPTLINPNYEKDFILYAFGGVDTISAMLCQQNEGQEKPIAFFSHILQDYEMAEDTTNNHQTEEQVALILTNEEEDVASNEETDATTDNTPNQIDRILEEFHNGPAGGHLAARATTLKIMRPIQIEKPFSKWGLDFIGPINPLSGAGHKWILTTTDYFTKWTEAVTLKEANENLVMNFYQDLVSRFGTPDAIISDNALAFIGLKVSDWSVKNNVFLSASSNYYPQGNGRVELTNKNLIKIIKKYIQHNQRTWHEEMKLALWPDRMTPKRATGFLPYVLVYGKEAKLPISIEFPTHSYIKELEMLEEQPMEIRLAQLMELEETRKEAFRKLEIHHSQMKKTFDKKAVARTFNEGNLVFKWDELKS